MKSLWRILPTNKVLGEAEILEESILLIVKLQQQLMDKMAVQGVPEQLKAAGLEEGRVDVARLQEAVVRTMPSLHVQGNSLI